MASQGILYYLPSSRRSNWLGHLIKALNLDIDFVDQTTSKEFEKEFPLKKGPAFIDSDGFKLTELLSVVEYLISISDNSNLKGKNVKDAAQVLRWLSYINHDVIRNWSAVAFGNLTGDANNKTAILAAETKNKAASILEIQFKYIDNELSTRKYLSLNDYITVADEYLFAWYDAFASAIGGINAENYPHIFQWHETIRANDPVAAAIVAQ
jgi:elongation factor 1-gamma